MLIILYHRASIVAQNIRAFSNVKNHARIEITAGSIESGFQVLRSVLQSDSSFLYTAPSDDIFRPLSNLAEKLGTGLWHKVHALSSKESPYCDMSMAEASSILDTISTISAMESLLCDFLMKGKESLFRPISFQQTLIRTFRKPPKSPYSSRTSQPKKDWRWIIPNFGSLFIFHYMNSRYSFWFRRWWANILDSPMCL